MLQHCQYFSAPAVSRAIVEIFIESVLARQINEVLSGKPLPTGRTDAAFFNLPDRAGLAKDMKTNSDDRILNLAQTDQTVLELLPLYPRNSLLDIALGHGVSVKNLYAHFLFSFKNGLIVLLGIVFIHQSPIP